ncbi:CAP domain-containing protein [Paludisphaera mucosa]|uniref:CAP domain-containing protein n=1 Tax=Paludisphaera mucosa TaxID=3030827 RepID=A0ABT6F872_9BACT|nr:CAP domain-containing protein [Paludisphaera mucosa]MDG3003686.1 CAP domain-containing protein [Paludisphaera mucosa]
MARPTSRRSLRFENLEDRQLLSSVAPNNDQQLALQLINMARTTPQAAAQWISKNVGSDVSKTLKAYNVDVNAVKATIANSRPLPPVAWNSNLADAAQAHSQDMADNQFQSHTGSDGSSADARIASSGYKAATTGENAFAYANSVDNAMQAFLYDWGVADAGHRRNLLQPGVSPDASFTDVGVGVAKSTGKVGPVLVTQDFGSRSNAPAQLVGVVYGDSDGNDFYTPGEGQGGVEIDATNLDSGKTASTKTWDSGGYQMPLSPGRYQVTASENNVVIKQINLSVANLNVAQDFLTSDAWDGRSLSAATAKSTPPAAPTVQAARVAPAAVTMAATSAPAPTPTPAPVTVSVASTPAPSNGSKVAVFAPSDWKGPSVTVASTPADDAATAKAPLANWTTWKANAR